MSKEQDQVFFRNFSLALGAIAVMMVIFYVVAQYAGSSDEADAKMRAAKVAEVTKPVGQVVAVGEEVEEATAEVVAESSEPAASDGPADGQSVYNGLCVNCHGIAALAAMIPQTGDAAAWEARITKGIDALYSNAINGYTGEMGMMPAKGGNPALSDDDVKAAVDFMIGQVQ